MYNITFDSYDSRPTNTNNYVSKKISPCTIYEYNTRSRPIYAPLRDIVLSSVPDID